MNITKEEILQKVQEVFRQVFDDEELSITFNTKADDIEDWDSLAHIQLVVGIEKVLGIKFTSKEIHSWPTVGKMIDTILTK